MDALSPMLATVDFVSFWEHGVGWGCKLYIK